MVIKRRRTEKQKQKSCSCLLYVWWNKRFGIPSWLNRLLLVLRPSRPMRLWPRARMPLEWSCWSRVWKSCCNSCQRSTRLCRPNMACAGSRHTLDKSAHSASQRRFWSQRCRFLFSEKNIKRDNTHQSAIEIISNHEKRPTIRLTMQ